MSTEHSTDQFSRAPLVPLAATLIPGGVLSLLTATIIGIAIPEVTAEFPAHAAQVHWVATVSLLAAGIAIPISGWTTVRFGIRRTWLVALGLLIISSIAVALAPTLPLLIAFRVAQGLGAGALEPVMLTALARAAGPARMGRVMGIAGASMSLGPLFGPLLGGLLVESIGWRWIFGIIAAGSLIILLASLRTLPREEPGAGGFDAIGLLLLSAASVMLLAGLSRIGRDLDIAALALVTGGIIAIGALIAWLRRRGEHAIIDPGTFRSPGFAPGVVIMFLVGAAIYPLLFGLPQFYREAMDRTPLTAALMIGPYAVGTLSAMPFAGRLSDRIGARPLVIIGAVLTTVAALCFMLAGTAAPLAWLAVLTLLIGIGTGNMGGPTVGATYRALPPRRIPSGSTILFVANQIGGAAGIASSALLIGALDPTGTWSRSVGTWPLLLPVGASLLIGVIALRLDRGRADSAPVAELRGGSGS